MSDKIELEGVVQDFSRDLFRVEVDSNGNKTVITCKPSGKIRKNSIKIVPGDKVMVEVSPYDFTKGIIKYRSR